MSANSPFTLLGRWLLPATALVAVAAAVVSYARSDEPNAGADSPYYGAAVAEALRGLTHLGTAPAQTQPAATPPPNSYWCENCKKYHPNPPGGQPPAAAAPTPAAAPDAQPAGAAEVIPPLPAPYKAEDYYWCANCKAYHLRKTDQPVHPQTPAPP